ncbi:hypothetical protein, partial [Streptomyces minutiscleroticus]|uniref:hypothetical protein n=1 Tax=Streptomyces minutiscleroticus TaxID=68238 RepID=UPI003331E8CE
VKSSKVMPQNSGFRLPLGQHLQQPALTGQPQPRAPGPVDQHRDELLVRRAAGTASPTGPPAGRCSAIDLLTWRLSLDQQIRR